MVRLADLSEGMLAAVNSVAALPVEPKPWTDVADISRATVALVSSAGLGLRAEPRFRGGEGGYRELPHGAPDSDIVMSHVSVNFDRTGYQLDLETILPRRRLDDMVKHGKIGAVADTHYSFMGATDPVQMEAETAALAEKMHARGVDAAVLLPV